jgi:tRNA-2-methylthio-N6-dimethylallyladenosine synthase
MTRQETKRIDPLDIARQLNYCDQVRALLDQKLPGERLACVDTYGCQQNEADSERLRGFLSRMGYGFTQDEAHADIVLLNTCAVRENAENRVYGNVGALVHTKRRNPNQTICVCGCMAQEPSVAEKLKKSFPHVNLVFGTHMLWKFPELLHTVLQTDRRLFETEEQPGAIAEGLPVLRQNQVKAWVSIMYGCNNFCTYCIVPHVRGRERSRDPELIVEEVEALAQEGYREITLLGQNVNSYGRDLAGQVDFAGLLERLSQIPGDFHLRFMTSHPKDAGERLFDVMAANLKVAPHLHLPFQSGSSRVLRDMNRGYTREQYLGLITALRARISDIVLTSDVIVGFPGETQEEFEETLSLVREVRFDALFTFIFSPREGTPAATMPDPMPAEKKKANFQRLVEVQNEISAEKHRSYIGKTLPCLIDGEDDRGNLTGRTAGNRLVHLTGPSLLIGTRRPVTITSATTWALGGELAAD